MRGETFGKCEDLYTHNTRSDSVQLGRPTLVGKVFIRADIALSAFETFLFNGLYKFTLLTYLLIYLL